MSSSLHVPALPGDACVRFVRGDDMVRGAVVAALEEPKRVAELSRTGGKARLEQLGAQVVLIEDEARTRDRAPGDPERPEDVGRVAGLDRVDPAASPKRAPRGGRSWRRSARTRRSRRASRLRQCAAGTCRASTPSTRPRTAGHPGLRADDGDLVSRLDQRSALEPDPSIERYREVLDDDEHPGGRRPLAVLRPASPTDTRVAGRFSTFGPEPAAEVDDVPRRVRRAAPRPRR